MTRIVHALIIWSLMRDVKADLTRRWPAYAQQIAQVGMPTVGYRNHMAFRFKCLCFIRGEYDPFRNPQIIIARTRLYGEMTHRQRHEIEHHVIFGGGLPLTENKRIDRH